MSQPALGKAFATNPRLETKIRRPQRNLSNKPSREELEQRVESLQKDYADLHAEIFEAAQVHRKLCAPRLMRFGDFEIASEIFAVRHLAGDFFTVRHANAGVLLSLGDICGKGLAAGMWTTHLVGLVGARAAVSSDPESIVSGVNRDVCLTASMVPLASLFIARLEPLTGKLEYCSAGHPPALLLRSNGQLELLSDGGLLLGVLPGAPYVRGRVQLNDGDVLLTYSDGVLESMNSADEEFGAERIETHLRRAAYGTAEEILFSVLGAVQDFAAIRPIVDDMSLVVVRRDALALKH